VCRSKHVEPSINFGIINSITKLHLVGISTELPYLIAIRYASDILPKFISLYSIW